MSEKNYQSLIQIYLKTCKIKNLQPVQSCENLLSLS